MRGFSVRREMASILLYYVVKSGFSREAWRVYHGWRRGRIGFRGARRRLLRLVRQRRGGVLDLCA